MSRYLSYRPEIDGLRSVAVLSVLLFHALPEVVTGGFIGVDIFFVISGYLIGSMLISEYDQTGRINLLDFWARRTRRLVPPALFVLALSLAFAIFILPAPDVAVSARDAILAAVYMTNWQNLVEAISYFDDGGDSRLFLHYWSLAVEEQFYFYLIAIFWFSNFLGHWSPSAKKNQPNLVIAFAAISLLYCFFITSKSQPEAYFGTHSRLWQLSVGVLVAFAAQRRYKLEHTLRGAILWLCSGMFVVAIAFLNGNIIYPGYYALLPTLCAALFLLVSSYPTLNANLVVRLLSTAPTVFIGKWSYSIYLWHWPVFILWRALFNSWEWVDIAGAFILTLALAIGTYYCLERPVRFSEFLKKRPGFSVALLSIAVFFAIGAFAAVGQGFGPARYVQTTSGRILDLEAVGNSLPKIYSDGCHLEQDVVRYDRCTYSDANSGKRAFLFGDSHAAHWFPALEPVLTRHGYALVSRTKSACAPIDVTIFNSNYEREYTECAEWREHVLEEIARISPDIVFIGMSSAHRPYIPSSGRSLEGAEAFKMLERAEKSTIDAILATGSKVVLFRDTPWLVENPLACLATNNEAPGACVWTASNVLKENSFPRVQYDDAKVHTLDLTGELCPDGVCSAIQHDVVMMRDSHHLAVDFSVLMSEKIEDRLKAAQIFSSPSSSP